MYGKLCAVQWRAFKEVINGIEMQATTEGVAIVLDRLSAGYCTYILGGKVITIPMHIKAGAWLKAQRLSWEFDMGRVK